MELKRPEIQPAIVGNCRDGSLEPVVLDNQVKELLAALKDDWDGPLNLHTI
jgi:hypothetical protein